MFHVCEHVVFVWEWEENPWPGIPEWRLGNLKTEVSLRSFFLSETSDRKIQQQLLKIQISELFYTSEQMKVKASAEWRSFAASVTLQESETRTSNWKFLHPSSFVCKCGKAKKWKLARVRIFFYWIVLAACLEPFFFFSLFHKRRVGGGFLLDHWILEGARYPYTNPPLPSLQTHTQHTNTHTHTVTNWCSFQLDWSLFFFSFFFFETPICHSQSNWSLISWGVCVCVRPRPALWQRPTRREEDKHCGLPPALPLPLKHTPPHTHRGGLCSAVMSGLMSSLLFMCLCLKGMVKGVIRPIKVNSCQLYSLPFAPLSPTYLSALALPPQSQGEVRRGQGASLWCFFHQQGKWFTLSACLPPCLNEQEKCLFESQTGG